MNKGFFRNGKEVGVNKGFSEREGSWCEQGVFGGISKEIGLDFEEDR